MNEDSQRRQILKFLKGNFRNDIDAFCVYQWIDRCYFQRWWALGIRLASCVPPNSLPQDYHRRLDYLIAQCRSRLDEEFADLVHPATGRVYSVPKMFLNVCETLGVTIEYKLRNSITLAYHESRIAQIENATHDGCTFLFSCLDRDALITLLNDGGFEHLLDTVTPKENGAYAWSRLKISWDDAPGLVQYFRVAGARERIACETRTESNRGKGGAQTFAPKYFHQVLVNRLEEHLNRSLFRKKRTCYLSKDNRLALVCAISKEYRGKKHEQVFWFGFHRYQCRFLLQAEMRFVAYGCGSPENIALIPLSDLAQWLDGLSFTEKGENSYWHVRIYRTQNNIFLQQNRGIQPIDLMKYLLPNSESR